jgi:PST family polysaccharide transporter
MNLVKTSLLNGVAVLVRMLTLLGLNKILAIYVGPAGYAVMGQFQNAVQMITVLASGAINTGVTKYTAEYHEDEDKQRTVWRTAGTIALAGSLLTALLVILFNRTLAAWFLKDAALGGVFVWFGAALVFFVFNTLLLAILNGKKEIKRYVVANIAGSLFALCVTATMAIRFGLYGALVALAIYQSLSFFTTLLLTYKAPWFRLDYLFGRIDPKVAANLARYTLMALTAAVSVPLSHILIRNHLGETLGWNFAGYWEAMWRLSGAYLMLVTTTLGVYYLPRLSELRDPGDIKLEILQGYKLILPVAAACATTIYLLRDTIIRLLFSAEFDPMAQLFAWQMVGDTLKIGSWILAYLMLGKAMMKLFVASEVVFAALFFFLTVRFVDVFGFQGVAMAHAANYAIYWLLMAWLIPRALRTQRGDHASRVPD